MRDYLDRFYGPPGTVEHRFLEEASYVMDECLDCGLLYQRQIPGDHLMHRLYERWIDPEAGLEQYEARHLGPYYVMLTREIAGVVDHFGPPFSRLKLFDFGMGWGHWCMLAKGFGCQVYGSELSQVKINQARRNGIGTLTWDQIPDHEFDYIHTEQVFEHLPDPLDTLRHLVRALKPGGLIKIAVPNGWDIKRKLSAWDWTAAKGSANSLNPVAPLEHINCFHHDAIMRMVAQVGLTPMADLAVSSGPPSKPTVLRRVKTAVKPVYVKIRNRFNHHEQIKSTRLHFMKPVKVGATRVLHEPSVGSKSLRLPVQIVSGKPGSMTPVIRTSKRVSGKREDTARLR